MSVFENDIRAQFYEIEKKLNAASAFVT